ncbi:DUF3291 domain-containing protein [Ilumatobacter sp.]|uniref:DUF3291 domain-containing protein n=1 Tax=Ilumatobacter sp. TaxID=1967498 RepID=UPI003C4CAE54
MAAFHLAQLNLGLFRAPLDSDEMTEFRLALEPINAIAEATPGFVWRLTDEDGGSASYVRVPGRRSPLWAPNLSVWTDLDSLHHFMYKSGHASYLRRRTEWFQPPSGVTNVLWWIPVGEIPSIADAVRRLDHLRDHGPGPEGFGFRNDVAPPTPPG